MSSIINKIKEKTSGHNDEQSFTTQPHPAKSNDPADLERPQGGTGLSSNPAIQAHHAKGPYIPSSELTNNLEQPASREELRARAAELNK